MEGAGEGQEGNRYVHVAGGPVLGGTQTEIIFGDAESFLNLPENVGVSSLLSDMSWRAVLDEAETALRRLTHRTQSARI